MATVPAHAHSLAQGPAFDVRPYRLDCADHLVPGDARILHVSKIIVLHQHIAVTNPAGFDLDSDLPLHGLRNIELSELEPTAGLTKNQSLHFARCHELWGCKSDASARQST